MISAAAIRCAPACEYANYDQAGRLAMDDCGAASGAAASANNAARLVIMFGDVVLRAIAEAKADTDVMISIADVERDDRRGHLAYIGRNADAARAGRPPASTRLTARRV